MYLQVLLIMPYQVSNTLFIGQPDGINTMWYLERRENGLRTFLSITPSLPHREKSFKGDL